MGHFRAVGWSVRRGLVVSTILASIGFLAIEIVFRIGARVAWSPYHTDLSIQGSLRVSPDPLLVWNNRPFYLDHYGESQHNELGMRVAAGDALMPRKDDNDYWVFLTGGSAMAGLGSNQRGEWLDITGVDTHPIESSIDGYLESQLQTIMPDRGVRVFNAAVPGSTVVQSRLNYQRLRGLEPDWVISMDGVNEPKSLEASETTWDFIEQAWNEHPSHKPPLRSLTFLTRRSAFLNALTKQVIFWRRERRSSSNRNGMSEARKKWLSTSPKPLAYAPYSDEIGRAVDEFLANLDAFESELQRDGQKHLLLIQPRLSLRNIERMGATEKAVFTYSSHQDGPQHRVANSHYEQVYTRAMEKYSDNSSVFPMNAVHSWEGWVFVDNAHLTAGANERIAKEIADYISSDGATTPFQ